MEWKCNSITLCCTAGGHIIMFPLALWTWCFKCEMMPQVDQNNRLITIGIFWEYFLVFTCGMAPMKYAKPGVGWWGLFHLWSVLQHFGRYLQITTICDISDQFKNSFIMYLNGPETDVNHIPIVPYRTCLSLTTLLLPSEISYNARVNAINGWDVIIAGKTSTALKFLRQL